MRDTGAATTHHATGRLARAVNQTTRETRRVMPRPATHRQPIRRAVVNARDHGALLPAAGPRMRLRPDKTRRAAATV